MKRASVVLRTSRSSLSNSTRSRLSPASHPGSSSSGPFFGQQTIRSLSSSSKAYDAAPSSFTTINQSEISHFSRLSSQWWSPTGEFKLLHRMNPTRLEYIRQRVAFDERDEPEWTYAGRKQADTRGTGRWLQGKRCLDVGCGGGLLSESLARLGGDVVGVDASESNITIANLHASQDPFLPYKPVSSPLGSTTSSSSWFASTTTSAGSSSIPGSLEYRHTSAEALRDAGEKFDVVCAMEVLEHVDEPAEFMRCLGEMVKPGGHLIISTISRTPLARLLTLTMAEDVLRLVSPGTHTYSKFVKPSELRRFVYSDMGGFDTWEPELNAADVRKDEVGETKGIVYDPLGGVWRLWGGAVGTISRGLGEGCNYMFGARKRVG
ncbi:S-adenosyl-L-methionine-dependent methyltransferase [Naematelia encephala]|uniref:Ubiquinone biosynthesis O-methyltransferase, mitochondrial n=1 Tax=Naematelia encephala TaxID=71784 RepID=A0A1Y2AK14_9TREE|nr:S-adenosyl-L-methionine-dependent methyltransferase [Naematelia encephala]